MNKKWIVENTNQIKLRSLEVVTELLFKKVSNLEKSLKSTCGWDILKYPQRINDCEEFCHIKLFAFYFIEFDEQHFAEHLTS